MTVLPNRFILYRREWDASAGKWGKYPCDPHGTNIDAHDSSHWRSYEETLPHATFDPERPKAPYGVAFVFNGDGWFLLDLDGCYVNEKWTAEASGLFQSFGGAYGEVSTSGTGLHVIGQCDPRLPETHKNKWDGDKEFYTNGRFVALSQHGLSVIGDGEYTGKDWTDQLRRIIPERPYLGELPDGRDDSYTGPEDDDELIRMMLRSASSASKFGGGVTAKHLWEADAAVLGNKFPDPSRPFDASAADAALMSHLAFWTGKDMPRMDRLFRRSALMRDKYEKREDYRRDTIQGAARLCKKVYDRPRNEAPAPGKSFDAILTIPEQIEYFDKCVYVISAHKVLTPDGHMFKPEQFRAAYGGHKFIMDPDSKTTKDAFEALTQNQLYRFPKAFKAVFHPELPFQAIVDGDGVNVYKPPELEMEPGDITPFWNWFERILPDPLDRRKLMAWCIDVVQNPGRKMLWAPVMIGTEGNGKSLLFEIVMRAVGIENTHVPRAKEINGTFNAWQAYKLLIHMPEAHMSGRRDTLDDLKPCITDYRMPIRDMHAVETNMHVPTNWCFSTNHEDAIIKTRSDRRYATFITAQRDRTDVLRDFPGEFFTEFWDWLRDVGFKRMIHYLHHAEPDAEYSPVHAGVTMAPETSTTSRAIAASTGGIEAEVNEAVESESVGFRGGWISSWALDKLLRSHNYKIGRPRVASMLTDLGYIQWGRAPRPILREDSKRPVLWCRPESVNDDFTQYLSAQAPGYD